MIRPTDPRVRLDGLVGMFDSSIALGRQSRSNIDSQPGVNFIQTPRQFCLPVKNNARRETVLGGEVGREKARQARMG